MSSNRAIAYVGTGKVEVQKIAYPKLETPRGRRAPHGAVLKVVSTNICGSDQHMIRGRTTAPVGVITGQVHATGSPATDPRMAATVEAIRRDLTQACTGPVMQRGSG